jgi:hypothetical protein
MQLLVSYSKLKLKPKLAPTQLAKPEFPLLRAGLLT